MDKHIKQAIILSAGFGTRLRPVTDNIPKAMVPIVGKPLLLWHIEQFKKHGIKELFINLHYLPDVIKNYFGDGKKFGVKITYSFEPEILGTAGGVKQFEKDLADAFFVVYGDMFSLVDYSKMTEEFCKKPDAIGMMMVGRNDHPRDSDLVEVDESMKFLKFHPKPHGEELLARLKSLNEFGGPENFRTMDAVFILKKDILKYIPAGKYYEIDHELLPAVLAGGKDFYGYETDDYLKDIGTIERYEEVEKYLKTR